MSHRATTSNQIKKVMSQSNQTIGSGGANNVNEDNDYVDSDVAPSSSRRFSELVIGNASAGRLANTKQMSTTSSQIYQRKGTH